MLSTDWDIITCTTNGGGSGGEAVTVIDDLLSTSPNNALSANMGNNLDLIKEDSLGNPLTDDFILSSKADGTRSWVINIAGVTAHELLNNRNISGQHTTAAITDLDNQLAAKELSLGNPVVDNYILASKIDGTRSWTVNAAGVNDHNFLGGLNDVDQHTIPVITGLQAELDAAEPDLGLPSVTGYVLASNTAGGRFWTAMTGGGGGGLASGVDGGFANSVYLAVQSIDGGSANG